MSDLFICVLKKMNFFIKDGKLPSPFYGTEDENYCLPKPLTTDETDLTLNGTSYESQTRNSPMVEPHNSSTLHDLFS